MIQARTFAALLASGAAFSWAMLGCDKGPSPSRGGPRAELLDSGLLANAPPPGTKAVFYKFGPPDSKIGFTGAKVTKKHEGAFGSFVGTVGLVKDDPIMSAVQVSIDLESLTIDPAKLAGHLKSADFFDVAKFPKASFTSTTIRPGEAPSQYHVTGKFNLHGVTKPLTFPATIRVTPGAVDAEGELTISRKDYGIVYPGMADDLIQDDVVIKLTIHAASAPSGSPPSGSAPHPASPADAHTAD